RHGGAAADRRRRPQLRHARLPGAQGRRGLPARRARPHQERHPGAVLRRRDQGARRAAAAGRADRRGAAARRRLLRGRRLGHPHPRGDPGARGGHPPGEGRGGGAGDGRRVREGHRRPPRRLAHAAAPVAGGRAVMRVGIVCPYSWDVPGGVKQHVDDLAQALMEQGHEISVIAPASDDDELPAYVTGAGRAVPVPYNGSVARMSFGFLSAARVRRWVRNGRFDVLHIHEPLIPSLGVLACWAAKGPIVATFHASFTRSRAIAMAEPLLQSALEKLSARIAVSDAARKSLVEQFGGDTVLIPNGVTVSRYTHAEPLGGHGPDGATIGFLGRMDEERKGLPILLDAFNLLAPERPDVKLLIAGPG